MDLIITKYAIKVILNNSEGKFIALGQAEHFIAKLYPVIIRKILCTMDLAE
jgi:hypothetical protein